jgi:nitroreductase
VELRDLLARRRMTRSFDATPVDLDWLEELCALALWAPTAGNSAGVRMNTLAQGDLPAYFDVATDPAWRASSPRLAGLMRAGGAVLVTSRPEDYLARYGASDKATSGLANRSAWPLPYWHSDAAMATMALLLLLEENDWQAVIWGNFRHDDDVRLWAQLGEEELFATVLIGKADGLDVPSRSLGRDVPTRHERVRRIAPRS